MVRVTDENSNPFHPNGYFRTTSTGGANTWSSNGRKFYVVAEGRTLAYSFDRQRMTIGSLPGAKPGKGLPVPIGPEGSFSFTDPDLIYGTNPSNSLQIISYRFSTRALSLVLDTSTCGMQPPLIPGPQVSGGADVTPSLDDHRLSISEGGASSGKHMFVVVYDETLGCRWYNTQTGQIGGHWGPSGAASTSDSFLVGHVSLSRSGNYVRIPVNGGGGGFYVWDVGTLQVQHCPLHSELNCSGYTAPGYNSMVQSRSLEGPMDIVKRPLSDVSKIEELVWPPPPWNKVVQNKHFSWNNVDINDSVPVCSSSYDEADKDDITVPYEGEIFCIETDGLASTVWRFAHNRAHWYPQYFNTQPLGNISRDGRFFMFTSGWDEQLGTAANGTPRTDVWIVKLQ